MNITLHKTTDSSESILDRFLSAQAETSRYKLYHLWKEFYLQKKKKKKTHHASDTIKALKKLRKKRNMNDEVRDMKKSHSQISGCGHIF